MRGKIVTVLGEIKPEQAGIVLTHEHLVVDATSWCVEPEEMSQKILAHSEISLPLLGRIRANPELVHHNMRLDEIEVAIDEVREFSMLGGRTIVCCSNRDIGRDPLVLVRIASATGLNVVMGSGHYIHKAHPADLKNKAVDEIAEELAKDFGEGVGPRRVRAGIIGEIGVYNPMHPDEEKVLRASAQVQKRTGAPICVHPGLGGETEMDIVRIMEEEGVDLNRVIMAHQDGRYPLRDDERKLKLHETLAKIGVYVAYDAWGAGWDYWEEGIPPDYDRIWAARWLIERGCIERLLFSHDVCTKTQLTKYGGNGYTHLFVNVPKMMRKAGLSESEIAAIYETVFVDNPKRVLSFA